uniref:Uncharacterized protein n=1 Tax=Romanomermis culicivorax TaxID=13658 RepID=A0A915KG01_ROMCU
MFIEVRNLLLDEYLKSRGTLTHESTWSGEDNYQTYEFWTNGIPSVNNYVLEFRSELGKLGKTVLVFYSNRKECNDKKDCVLNIEWQNNAEISSTLNSCAELYQF